MKKAILWIVLLALCVPLCACKASETQLIAYIDETLSEPEGKALAARIQQIPAVKTAQYVTAEEALEQFKEDYENDEAFSGLDASYLRSRFIVTTDSANADAVEEALAEIPGIVKVNNIANSSVVQIGFWLQERLQ